MYNSCNILHGIYLLYESDNLLFFPINHKVIFDYLFKSSYMPV